jgi:hypothetical protein
MKDRFPAAFAIGVVLVAVAVAGILFMQRDARVELKGSILKVRTTQLSDNSSVAVLDFRFANPSKLPFVVRTVTVVLEDKDGNQYDGQTISEVDAKRLFDAIPVLGQKYNTTLLIRDKIPAKGTEDRMVAARFEAPETRLDARKRFLIRIEDVDGPITEISEK